MTRLHPDLGFTPDAGFKIGQCIALAAWGCFTFGFFIPTLRKNGCLMFVSGFSPRARLALVPARASRPCPRSLSLQQSVPAPAATAPVAGRRSRPRTPQARPAL